MDKKGIIFDISRFCLNDGPGIRTTVFLKGCPLKCLWCHNPESQNPRAEILFASEFCKNCRLCVNVCQSKCHKIEDTHTFDRTLCKGCGLCAEVCPTNALRLAGRIATAQEIIKEVIKDKVFYEESGGGLTVSGGEPMVQLEFLETLLCLAKQEGLHTCIETCGYTTKDAFKKILPLTDCFLFDWKESNPQKHKEFTGKDNGPILENMKFLNDEKANIILRIPLIPEYNDSDEHINGIAELANKYHCIKKIEIMPYHPLGISKAKELDWQEYCISPIIPSKAYIDEHLEKLRSKVNVTVEVFA